MAQLTVTQIEILSIMIFFSGFISGLIGFGLATLLAPLLFMLPPKQAIPLFMGLSILNQLLSLWKLRKDMPKSWNDIWPKGPGPAVLGGVICVPLGIYLLHHLREELIMVMIGSLLTIYSIYSLFKPARIRLQGFDGPITGMIVGGIGGIIGGFAALPAITIVVWTELRSMSKEATRSFVQPYILILQGISLLYNAILHPDILGHEFWKLVAIAMPAVWAGTLIGLMIYRQVSDVYFHRISFILLGVIGIGILLKLLF